MKTLKYTLLPILFLATSCYIYKPYVEKDESEINKNNAVSPATSSLSSLNANEKSKQQSMGMANVSREQAEKEKMKQEQRQMEEDKKKQQMDEENRKKENMKSSGEGAETSENTQFSSSKNANIDGNQGKRGKQDINSIDKPEPQVVEKGIKGKLQPNRFYKITARDKQFKIQVDKWDGDSLVSHIIRRPEKVVKLHKDEINEDLILERRFSRPFSDLFTVGAYAAGAAVVLLIVL